MKLKVKVKNMDEEIMVKNLDLKIGSNTIASTPIKAGNYSLNPASPINEMYMELKRDKLDKCLKDESEERALNNRAKKQMLPNHANFLFVNYADEKIPEFQHIEMLSDLQYSFSDVVITPIFSKLISKLDGDNLLNTFIELTNEYIQIIEKLNHKSIIGVIPAKMPRQFLGSIVENYYNQNITSFVIDFGGKSADANHTWMRGLFRLFKQYDLIEESFIYSINAREGKFTKNANEIPAKDFISVGFGMDILGLNHVRQIIPPEAGQKIKKERRENTYRLFNKQTYGYVKKKESDLKLIGINNRNDLKKNNISQQYDETLHLQRILNEDNTLKMHMERKSQIDDKMINKMVKLKKEINSSNRSLDDYI